MRNYRRTHGVAAILSPPALFEKSRSQQRHSRIVGHLAGDRLKRDAVAAELTISQSRCGRAALRQMQKARRRAAGYWRRQGEVRSG